MVRLDGRIQEAIMAKDVPQMVRGLSMAVRLITNLTDEIKVRGGYEEILYFLTTDAGKENLSKVADLLVSLKWRLPKSLIMRLARERSISDHSEQEEVEWDTNFDWIRVLPSYVPLISLLAVEIWDEYHDSDSDEHLTEEVVSQLVGKTAAPGMVIEWGGNLYVIVGFSGSGFTSVKVGDVITKDNIDVLDLAPLPYFDLNA